MGYPYYFFGGEVGCGEVGKWGSGEVGKWGGCLITLSPPNPPQRARSDPPRLLSPVSCLLTTDSFSLFNLRPRSHWCSFLPHRSNHHHCPIGWI
ncbi:MAG: hypothetical protein EWV53_06190 [Microcystis panniformis Mp_MB_F_20051200_S9]|uniref:Uncharacterized protein n=1 Tax=Microcystis panniformis Mp_MB_F_20051200_S9 TaxID=2486223 RepID=A0A552Q5T7_9CHRO|nr:MAG: hypothetical protein EWV43_23695 [Microcystis panniformis Mp_MB_F_20080800_S26D]TRV46168.1 MAG: hypothetical protein EWV42_18745 [Microcystis panniformis Mp_GB_SS_20050300_S99D]TRV50095.1 MAG: hypothetical protein EWV87_09130 [Microcystis panniformis Mp_GB_SS_20050300_S99]TRV56232.1 MAG: hypothetical protein EWV86_22995 [Microcystis panniformis Mp_MB_F_20051200_S9D]TRV57924.1 MAG: hypothetical protein EWV69_14990 [Microcystis panniformis Mp_MB_F_20080800_S26]TRV64593.1 MAG: hypothetica